MNRLIKLAIPLLLVAGFAGAATAQVVHDHRKKKPAAPGADIVSFAPVSGVAGTRVELRGNGFAPGDEVKLGTVVLAQIVLEPTRIVVTIPVGAPSGPLVLLRGGQRLVSSRTAFTVLDPTPVLSGVEPDRAPPGASVRIRGSHLGSIHSVLMGKQPLAITAQGPDFLQVTIPKRATAGDFLWVKGPGGEARSATPFVVEILPSVRRIEPMFARPGDSVTLWGAGFSGGDRLSLSGQPLHISQLHGDRIVAVLPAQAATGELVVERGSFRVVAAARYEVVQRPQIVAVTPAAGPERTPVTVRVRHDSPDLDLLYGATELKIGKRAAQPDGTVDLSITIPPGATDQFISVRNRGGEDRWGSAWNVHVYPVLTGVAPARAWERTDVTISGKHLMGADAVHLGAVSLPIVSRSPTALVVQIPANTPTGLLAVTGHGQRFESKLKVEVILRALIDRFSPGSGSPGSEVLITGRNFQPTTRAWLGKQEMPILRAALPTQLWVQVPAEATGPERISVGEPNALDVSRDPFVAIAAPTIADFAPRAGKPGIEVVLTGHQLGGQVEILLGTTVLPITRVEQGRIAVRLPVTMPLGSFPFQVRAGGTIVARTRASFPVYASAQMRMFTPRRVQPGQQVHIKGSGFDAGTRVFFGKTELPVVKLGPKGQQLWVQILDGLSGTDDLIVDDFGVRSQTEAKLTIEPLAPPPPPPPPTGTVIDHRKKKPK